MKNDTLGAYNIADLRESAQRRVQAALARAANAAAAAS
jgi:hypothetical protein